MSEVPRTRRSEYTGAYKDLQEQIDELRRKIEEIQAKDPRYVKIFHPDDAFAQLRQMPSYDLSRDLDVDGD